MSRNLYNFIRKDIEKKWEKNKNKWKRINTNNNNNNKHKKINKYTTKSCGSDHPHTTTIKIDKYYTNTNLLWFNLINILKLPFSLYYSNNNNNINNNNNNSHYSHSLNVLLLLKQ